MALTLTQSATAVAVNSQVSFLASGGTEPYVYAVVAGGAAGTINSSTGVYVAPAVINADPKKAYDTIRVTDAVAATTTLRILIGTPLILFCDIVQKEMGLANGRVYLWDQKIMQPTDSDLYIAVSVPSCKPFGNVNSYASATGGLESQQYVMMQARVTIDMISRGPEARDRKEEALLALASTYSQQQQTSNSFYIAPLTSMGGFINLSDVDGAAIPYRYQISVNMQYSVSKTKSVSYFDDFSSQTVINE